MATYSHCIPIPGYTAQELYNRIAEKLDFFLKKLNLKKYAIQKNPIEKSFHIQGPLFTACLTCEEAELLVKLQFSALASPWKTQLEKGIHQWIEKFFNMDAEKKKKPSRKKGTPTQT